MTEHTCYKGNEPWCAACREVGTTEVWVSVDDRGDKRRLVVEYDDDRDETRVSREHMHNLLILAGLRMEMGA